MHRTVATASKQQQPRIERCLSRQELNDRAAITLDELIPIRFYIRTADHLFNQAKVYRLERDFQRSYELYMRYCNLVITELKKHPEAKIPGYKPSLIRLQNNAKLAMNDIEGLRPILDTRYENYLTQLEQYREQQAAAERAAKKAQEEADEEEALRIARQQEEEASRIARQQEEEYWAYHAPREEEWSLAKALEGVPGVKAPQSSVRQHQHQPRHSLLQTPLLPLAQYPEHTPTLHHAPVYSIAQPKASSVAPKRDIAPPLPKKPDIPKAVPETPHRLLDEDIPAYEDGLRTLIVPIRLLDRFLNLVRPNTIKNLETCGILAGTLSRNKFTVTTLIIPKQTATSDTCSTTNEDELFEFQMERDLMTLGWIHLMLPEAIAIVCAPKHDKEYGKFFNFYGVFRLTDPPGLQVITNCREKALFHQHPGEDNIYTDAADRGHVEFKDLDLEIVDLRNK
ncbi:hypothetical protein BGW41_002502 [Actinomortierella wolfii]|nr:hypothetical protein BGW41_002502 [Actinomortierella wolfii]